MGIKVELSEEELNRKIKLSIASCKEDVINALRLTCLEVVNMAKSVDTYKDQTNNLRSSIGYAIYDDGVKITDRFFQSGVGEKGDGLEGTSKGKNIADNHATMYPKGLVAVIVAGMTYAYEVESRGKDVLTGSWLQFDKIFKENLRQIGFK